MKVLNLYAGIGGNRKLWTDCDVTAVEMNPDIAAIYRDFFPGDNVVVGDAHQYLLDHYKEYDFIWASPPCPTHSKINHSLKGLGIVRYPEMELYQEIILLQNFCDCKWVIENVVSYYQPLIPPSITLDRHYFWCNFQIDKYTCENVQTGTHRKAIIREAQIPELLKLHGTKDFNIPNKRKVLRNCVKSDLGLHIFNCALDRIDNTKLQQLSLF